MNLARLRFSLFGRTAWRAGLSAALMWASLGTLCAWAEAPREARIQAVLILRMMKFVDWPPDSLARVEGLQICTWGDSPTESALQNLQGQKIREREIRVRKLSAPIDTRGCQVLFVSNTARDVTPTLLYGSGSYALLTISDMPDFNKRGGMINLVRQDNRVGFEVQLSNAREHGIQIGAPLLDLAWMVE